MASVYKPSYSTVDKKTGQRVLKRTRKWYVEYRDASGRLVRVPGYVDKRATEKLALELEQRAARGQMGMHDPYAAHRGRPLEDHLSDYRRHLEAKEDAPRHVAQTERYIRRILQGCEATMTGDLSAERVTDWLSTRRRSGLSARSVNYYLTALKGFLRWMVKERRTADNPIAHLSGINVHTDVRRERRSIDTNEVLKLIDQAKKGPVFRGLSGEDRAILYMVASYTGLRSSELASLKPESFDLTGKPPTVTVEAAYSKRRRKDVLPLHTELASILKPWIDQRPRGEPLWPGTWSERAAKMIRLDLEAAGIPYKDSSGRVFDFHAIRGQFISALARSGVHPRTAQLLARHSDINLTMNVYTKLGLEELHTAIGSLPSPTGSDPQRGESKGKVQSKQKAAQDSHKRAHKKTDTSC